MRAVKLVGTEAVEVQDAPAPRLESDTDAVVRITHTAICGADLLPYHGHTPGFELGTTLGHEFVGVVESAGDGVRSPAPGQRVVNTSMTSDGTCVHCRAGRTTQCASRALFGYSGVYPRLDGGQADLVRVPRADRCLWPVPDGVSNEDAVFVADILPTGMVAVEKCSLGLGELVTVLGCGPVGLMAVICASASGQRVIAVDGVPARRQLAESLGACAVDPNGAADAVSAATGGLGADAIVEASGSAAAMTSALGLVRPQGVVSVVGAHFEPDFPLNNATMFEKEITLTFAIGNPSRDRERLLRMIEDGVLRPSAVITDTLPLDDASAAYRAFDTREATKVVLTT
ncbi:MAG: alcohol dehydrogenase catalytic domain-containing protein [Solirubrobacterales bacterium]|nr:alcohol dehydrogenase catalytic domain-containing protein [Solirubrobacterales bacterium]MBV9536909.1 alcohol dehydrogenase catalytic domain-containing protein [Solirubrobacterales bacterium]